MYKAATDNDQLGIGNQLAGAGQVRRQRLAQLDAAARVAVSERRRRRIPESTAQRTRPGGARERSEVGQPRV